VRLLLGKIGKVQTSPCQKVLWLSNIHPIPLQIKGMQFSISRHLRENLLFNRCRPQLDPLQDIRVEKIDAGIDTIRDEFNGFFNEAFYRCGLGFHDDDAVFAGFFDFGDDDSAFLAMFFVELGEFGEGIVLHESIDASDGIKKKQ